MMQAITWSLGVGAALFLIVLGAEAALSADEDGWWRTREAWIQPLVAGGGAAAIIFVLWMGVLGVRAAL